LEVHGVDVLILFTLIINTSGFTVECNSMNCSDAFECLRKPHGVMCVCPKGMHYLNNKCSGKTKFVNIFKKKTLFKLYLMCI